MKVKLKTYVHRFVGLVNYYRYTWRKCVHALSPLIEICSTKLKFKWTYVEHKAFT